MAAADGARVVARTTAAAAAAPSAAGAASAGTQRRGAACGRVVRVDGGRLLHVVNGVAQHGGDAGHLRQLLARHVHAAEHAHRAARARHVLHQLHVLAAHGGVVGAEEGVRDEQRLHSSAVGGKAHMAVAVVCLGGRRVERLKKRLQRAPLRRRPRVLQPRHHAGVHEHGRQRALVPRRRVCQHEPLLVVQDGPNVALCRLLAHERIKVVLHKPGRRQHHRLHHAKVNVPQQRAQHRVMKPRQRLLVPRRARPLLGHRHLDGGAHHRHAV